MNVLNFRSKLLLAMMLLVVGVTTATLLITENQVRVSYRRHFQQSFNYQIESFLQQREARLAPVRDRVAEAASTPRLIAAMDIAGQPRADQQDVDDLYQNGIDQLLERPRAYQKGVSHLEPGFFFFLNRNGKVLYPSAGVKLPFSLLDLSWNTQQLKAVGDGVTRSGTQTVGYLAPQGESGNRTIREMVFTSMTEPVTHQQLGVLAVGFSLIETAASAGSKILSGIWLDDQLYSSSIATNLLARLAQDFRHEFKAGRQVGRQFMLSVDGVPHQVYYQTLNTVNAFPPAFQVCLYSLADASTETISFRRKILVSGTLALLGALGLSLLISRGLAVPLQELAAGAMEIEQGNYSVKVPVRSRDEIGHMAQAFNDMAERIGASHAAQEQRIAERTQELAERKRAEEALRQSEASLREAQRIAHLGNWDWNVATNELRWSQEIYSIFGLAPEQFSTTYEAFLERVHPGDRERINQAVRESLKAGKPYSLNHRVMRPDGEIRIVHEQAEVVQDDSGKTVRMVGTVQDITEQKRIEAEFLRAQRMDGIGALAGGMAHDLNNALSPILMGIQLMRRKPQDPETQQMLGVMEANTHRGAGMVRQVLTFARGREGDRELLDVGRLLREMENIARQTLSKSIRVAALVPSDLWPVLGNSTQLHQVLLNLCINARDAMPKGGELTLAADNVTLNAAEAEGIPKAAPGSYVMLLVADTGTGIPPEILPRIFEPFFTTKDAGQGTGLGLSTIARIVRNHGGFVQVKSELGAGATFEIYFPRAASAQEAAPTPSAAAMPRGHGELILLLEDDRSVRDMVASSLGEYGYRVVSATSGKEASTLLTEKERDLRLVLSNFSVSGFEGPTALEAVRSRRPDLRIIVMSGEFDSVAKRPTAGVVGFLSKPFTLEQLLVTVAKGLQGNGSPT